MHLDTALVITVEPYPLYEAPDGTTRVALVGTGSKIYFALAGRASTDAASTETEPYWNVVTECPKDVAGLFLDPVL